MNAQSRKNGEWKNVSHDFFYKESASVTEIQSIYLSPCPL